MLNKPNDIQIDTSVFNTISDIKKRQEAGEKIDDYTKQAIKTVEFASAMMDAILSGRQIDLAFYRLYTKNAIANLRKLDQRKGVNRKIKTRIEGD